MKTQRSAIILIIVSSLFTAAGQFLLKSGTNKGVENGFAIITNIPLIGGLIFYFIAAILLIYSLKKGELSVLYPIYAISYIWVLLISYFFFNESINLLKLIGVLLIMIGVSFVGAGSHE